MLNKKIILGVTGSIAAYKAAELIRLLKKGGADVQVVMTKSAKEFISPLTLQALSGKPVLENIWEPSKGNGMDHINLSREVDLILIAPASANFVAKLANGLADDLLSNLCLARNCPLLIAPAMNKEMWLNPATQRNIKLIHNDNIQVSGPENGEQACGEEGFGRLINEKILLLQIRKAMGNKKFSHKKILISCGGTIENIDDARAITNLSSGRMGFNIAEVAFTMGAEVTLVYGRTDIPAPEGIKQIYAPNHNEMEQTIMKIAANHDIFISVAAISDYLPTRRNGKIKKDKILKLELTKSRDILANTASKYNHLFCVGFSAESESIIKNGQLKLKNKKVDLIVSNSINESMGEDSAEIYLVDPNEVTHITKRDKSELAIEIMNHVHKLTREKGYINELNN
jgi:phosphopantothenoylcysteine decarboxylase / phosphopantothenate---cysteine ligase